MMMRKLEELFVVVIAMMMITTTATMTIESYAQNATVTTTIPSTTTNMTTTNATTGAGAATNATNNQTVITHLTWWGSSSIGDQALQFSNPTGPAVQEPLSAANIQYQQTDPVFAKLAQTLNDCLTEYNSVLERRSTALEGSDAAYPSIEENNRQALCVDTVSQGVELLCDASDFANYDIARCEEARTMTETYLAWVGGLLG